MCTIINFISGLLVIAMLFLATGCKTADTTPTLDNGSSKHPPSDPAPAQNLRTSLANLDEARAEPLDESWDMGEIEEALRQEAVNPGAGPAFVGSVPVQATGATFTGTWRDRSLQFNDGRVMIDLDIKYH